MMGWQWHQLDHMQIICTLLETDNHASTSPLSFYRPDTLPTAHPPNGVKALKAYIQEQRHTQSTDGRQMHQITLTVSQNVLMDHIIQMNNNFTASVQSVRHQQVQIISDGLAIDQSKL